jgi:transcriptional adapter 2-alpha
MPARADFAVEYNNYAEMNLKDISFTNNTDPLLRKLEMTAVCVYWNVVKERVRRKIIVKRCGLVNVKKTLSYNRMYEHTLGYYRLDAMRVFQKLMKQLDWDMYNESWHYETVLKQCIDKLQEYRRAGLTTFSSAKIYDCLKHRRMKEMNKRHLFSDVITNLQDKWSCNQWLKKQALMCKVAKGEVLDTQVSSIIRKPSVPLDIVGLPGYDKLTTKEQIICSNVRLVPESYLDFKNSLMVECRKVGYLRLAQARSMIKIDVNKTRKIYDFLVEEGLVNKEPILK